MLKPQGHHTTEGSRALVGPVWRGKHQKRQRGEAARGSWPGAGRFTLDGCRTHSPANSGCRAEAAIGPNDAQGKLSGQEKANRMRDKTEASAKRSKLIYRFFLEPQNVLHRRLCHISLHLYVHYLPPTSLSGGLCRRKAATVHAC